MCLAIPMVLVERNEFGGVAEIDAVSYTHLTLPTN